MDRLKAWFTPQMVVAAVAAMFAGFAAVAQWVELTEGHGYYAGWLWGPLEWFRGRAMELLVVAIVLGLWSALWKWRQPLALWGTQRYVRALLRLSRPVTEDLAEIPCAEVGREEDSGEVRLGVPLPADAGGRVLEDLSGNVLGLDGNALNVLQFVLAAFDRSGARTCWVSAAPMFPDRWHYYPFHTAREALDQACHDLVAAEMVSRYLIDWRKGGARIWPRMETVEANENGELSRLVREQLKRRYP